MDIYCFVFGNYVVTDLDYIRVMLDLLRDLNFVHLVIEVILIDAGRDLNGYIVFQDSVIVLPDAGESPLPYLFFLFEPSLKFIFGQLAVYLVILLLPEKHLPMLEVLLVYDLRAFVDSGIIPFALLQSLLEQTHLFLLLPPTFVVHECENNEEYYHNTDYYDDIDHFHFTLLLFNRPGDYQGKYHSREMR